MKNEARAKWNSKGLMIPSLFIELRDPNSAPFGFKGTGSGSHCAIEPLPLGSGGHGVKFGTHAVWKGPTWAPPLCNQIVSDITISARPGMSQKPGVSQQTSNTHSILGEGLSTPQLFWDSEYYNCECIGSGDYTSKCLRLKYNTFIYYKIEYVPYFYCKPK